MSNLRTHIPTKLNRLDLQNALDRKITNLSKTTAGSFIDGETHIIIEKPKSVTELEAGQVYDLLNEAGLKINKVKPLKRFEISFKEGKVGIGRPALFEITLIAIFYTSGKFIITVKNWELLPGVEEAIRRMRKMVGRSKTKRDDGIWKFHSYH